MAVGSAATTGRDDLLQRFAERLVVNPDLDRALVSYQADKDRPKYRWLRYKEAFSSSLVEYVLKTLELPSGRLLDPFAGTGAALFASAALGWHSEGVEISPVAALAIRARIAARRIDRKALDAALKRFREAYPQLPAAIEGLPHLQITRLAYPFENEIAIATYRKYCSRLRNPDIRLLFQFAGLSVLEACSYTRKDGQFLRWDRRAAKPRVRATFNKGPIADFPTAVERKLRQIRDDLYGGLFRNPRSQGSSGSVADIALHEGSCLEILPGFSEATFDVVLTSPPYCNRYDYTRTYALELMYLGLTDEDVKTLRQQMLSCTVENQDKMALLESIYARVGRTAALARAASTCQESPALREVLTALEDARDAGGLNNRRIVDMVRGYFFEMSVIIGELARVVRRGGHVIMVNDNVRYAGEEIPVDLILSSFAEAFGLRAKVIWVLPRGKGNSSQQMGAHGRAELRKCVYVWERE